MNKEIEIPKNFLSANFNGWKLQSVLSKSAFGYTFKAIKNNKVAALKTVFNEELDNKINQEIETLKILKSEKRFFPQLLEYSNFTDEMSWVAIDFKEGLNLKELILRNGPLSELDWFNFSKKLFKTLEVLHSKNIIHQDIKPTNIIVSDQDVTLIDFGLSKILNSRNLMSETYADDFSSEMWAGTHEFASPEHYSGEHIPAMDVFSAASTLVFAARGKSPFSAKTNTEWMEEIGKRAPDLNELTENQIRFINPLFNKNKSDRPSANRARSTAESYIKLLTQNITDIQITNWPYFEDLRQLAGQIPDLNSDLYVTEKSTFSKKLFKLFPKRNLLKFFAITTASLFILGGLYWYTNLEKPGKFGVYDDKSTLGFNEATLKPQTIELRTKCKNLIFEKKYNEAYNFCENAANQGDAVAMFDLVTVITEIDETQDITNENRKIILNNLSKSYELGFVDSGFSLAYFKAIYNPNEIESAIKIYEKSWNKNPKLGSFEGLGYINYKGGNFNEAEILFKKEIELNNPDTIYTANESLGILLYDQKKWVEAKKYLTIASEGGKNDARFYLAEIFRDVDKNLPVACSLYESIKEVHDESNFANSKYCEGLRISFPIAQNVQIGSLSGRPYLGNDLYWRIPISIENQIQIEFTGVQFRDFEGKLPWSNISFKVDKGDLQTDVLVDSFFFLSLFKQDFCPEFRIVYEEAGEVKKIWEKPKSFCAV